MKLKPFALLILLVACASCSFAQSPPPSAKDVLAAAAVRAKAEEKVVFVGFHASWCGWCKKMEQIFTRPEVKPIIEKHFVVVWLTVMESEDKKSLENPGAVALLERNGGKNQGIPYFYFMNAEGKTIATSNRPKLDADIGGNIGCPAEPHEIAYFLEIVKKASPKVTDAELNTLKSAFETIKGGG